MNSTTWMIELGHTGWQIFVRRPNGDASIASALFDNGGLSNQAEGIAVALTDNGYQGEGIVLALGSHWCLSAKLPIERPQELRDRQTMLYRLEEWIPWGAEELVADFLAVGASAFAVAIRRDVFADFLRLLEGRGINVQSIVPLAILAATNHIERGVWPSRHLLAMERGGHVDLVTIEDSKPTRWRHLAASDVCLRLEVECDSFEHGIPFELVGYEMSAPILSPVDQNITGESDNAPTIDVTVTDLALSASEAILLGRIDAPIDLKQGPFGRRRVNVALRRYQAALELAAAVLLVSIIASLTYQGLRAGHEAERTIARQTDVFRAVFPNAKVPVGVLTRLRSELSKLQGLRGDDSTLPSSVSSIVVLERLLKAMPSDKRFRLLEIRIEEGRLYLDGETRVHSDAESIAQRLRAEGFDVSPPKSQRLDDQRVSLRITGTLSLSDRLAKVESR